MIYTLTAEAIIGALTLIGTILIVLHKSGLVSFGRQKAMDCKECPEHDEQKKLVVESCIAIKEYKMTSGLMSIEIQSLREDIKDIKNTIDKRDENAQIEFRRIREMIGELSGYVRGIHRTREES
jgi:vancomycin resistance protein YoaR